MFTRNGDTLPKKIVRVCKGCPIPHRGRTTALENHFVGPLYSIDFPVFCAVYLPVEVMFLGEYFNVIHICLMCALSGVQWYRVMLFAGCMAAMKTCRRVSPREHCRTWQVALCRASVSAIRTAIWRSRCWTARYHAPVCSLLASIRWADVLLAAQWGLPGYYTV